MTEPNVFIVESLSFEDEATNRLEGKFISHILSLNEKKSTYFYIRTKTELKKVIHKFDESGFRYLHLSCHGDSASIATTLDSITFDELGRILRPSLKDKRLFLSSCDVANEALARTLIPNSGCYSVVGPSNVISFSDAAILWAAFYHLMFKINDAAMKRRDLLPNLKQVSKMFDVPLSYFSMSKSVKAGYKLTKVQPVD